jgi:pimeloyl-ACP methyl ester carboxylesterase
MDVLADRFTCLAFDRPGFGNSDPLPLEHPAIEDYAAALKEDLDALGLDRFVLFGASTGAAIAAAFALEHPESIEYLILDNILVQTDEQRARSLTQHTPRFQPSWDGSHLAFLWSTLIHDIFVFNPRSQRTLATRRETGLPPIEAVPEIFLDALSAGDAGYVSYEALFRYRLGPVLTQLTVPTAVLFAASYDPEPPLAPTVTSIPFRRPGEGDVQVWSGALDQMAEVISSANATSTPPPEADPAPLPGRMSRRYVQLPSGQIHLAQNTAAPGRPLVMFPAIPFSILSVEGLADALAGEIPVYALDIPGLGDSDECSYDKPSIENYAELALEVLDAIGEPEIDLYGKGGGALIAIEVALKAPERARTVILENVPMFEPGLVDELLSQGLVSLEPRWDGAHLAGAWYALRAEELFFPWFRPTRDNILRTEPPDPNVLQERLFELLKGARTYPHAMRATYTYPVRVRLAALTAPTLIAAAAGHPTHSLIGEAGSIAANATATTLPEAIDPAAEILRAFLRPSAMVER